MTLLASIAATAQQVAEAISAVLEVETEILDEEFTIVAGTGKYLDLIGTKDDEAYHQDSEFAYFYTQIFKTGQAQVVDDPTLEYYGPTLVGEIGEICVPIQFKERIIGVLSLVAFNDYQREKLLGKKQQLVRFLEHMAFLLASRVSEKQAYQKLALASNQVKQLVETMDTGILAIDDRAVITHFNKTAESICGITKQEVIGRPIQDVLPNSKLLDVLATNKGYTNEEEFMECGNNKLHLLVSAWPLSVQGKIKGVMASFENMADARQLAYTLTEGEQRLEFDFILGQSPTITRVKNLAGKVAKGSSTILIMGESGTGKELFARAIHFSSPRRDKPLVTVNCGAIPEALLESELFGYEEGAFTGAKKGGRAGKFELANGGTIFLDEIGELPLHLQVKLLHVLQRRQLERVGSNKVIDVDVRIIAATNRDLEKMCRNNEFREDLYYRLSVIPLTIPPLRSRKEDLHILIDHFTKKHADMLGKSIRGVNSEASKLLHSYDWPGNIRELENTIEYAVNMETTSIITRESLPPKIVQFSSSSHTEARLKSIVDEKEKDVLKQYAEKMARGEMKKTEVARILGISRATLYRKLKTLEKD